MDHMSEEITMLQIVHKVCIGITATVFIGIIALLFTGALLVLTTAHLGVIVTLRCCKRPLNLTSAVRMASYGLESSSGFWLSPPSETTLVVQWFPCTQRWTGLQILQLMDMSTFQPDVNLYLYLSVKLSKVAGTAGVLHSGQTIVHTCSLLYIQVRPCSETVVLISISSCC